MTEPRDHRSLSRVELMVLARLSVPRAPTEAEIKKSLEQTGVPLTGSALADCVTATLAALRSQALIATSPDPATPQDAHATSSGKGSKGSKGSKQPRTRGKTPRFTLTERGRLALRDAFDLEAAPTWDDMREHIVPVLALRDRPGTEAAHAALRSAEAMTTTFLRGDRMLGTSLTAAQLCDQVIARALGMPPGPVTPAGIRAYALARHCGVDSKTELEDIAKKFAPSKRFAPSKSARSKKSDKLDGELKLLAQRLAGKQLGDTVGDKEKMVLALRRYWVSQQDETDDAQRPSAPWWTQQRSAATDGMSSDTGWIPPQPSVAAAADALLLAVREAMPRVGSDGRYGKENVFVSALWQRLARDRRLQDLSLDHFKRWLVAANREQLLALARADLIDDMDARLVEDSKIEDLGAIFHFVLDRREPSTQESAHHAR